jgi:glycosyltransferase involved in cell wall biosynthesis
MSAGAAPDRLDPLVTALRYAVITPVRDEAEGLRCLAAALDAQTAAPETWLVVDNGSRDGSVEVVEELAATRPWVRVVSIPPDPSLARGGPVARAFEEGVAALGELPDVVVKLDADVSFEPVYFATLLGAFAADARLGMASGSCYEEDVDGLWRQRHVTATTVWGASRAYRRECLERVLPLERRMGWDGVDELKANLAGYRTRTLTDLPFRHHRPEGVRDGRFRARANQGRAAYYMDYRPGYLVLRAVFNLRGDRASLGMVWGYAGAAVRREPRLADAQVRRFLRDRQRLRELPARLREARGVR